MLKTKMSSLKKQLMFRVSCFSIFFIDFSFIICQFIFLFRVFSGFICYETFNDQQRNKLITCLAIVFIIFILFFIFLGKDVSKVKALKQEVFFSNEFF